MGRPLPGIMLPLARAKPPPKGGPKAGQVCKYRLRARLRADRRGAYTNIPVWDSEAVTGPLWAVAGRDALPFCIQKAAPEGAALCLEAT